MDVMLQHRTPGDERSVCVCVVCLTHNTYTHTFETRAASPTPPPFHDPHHPLSALPAQIDDGRLREPPRRVLAQRELVGQAEEDAPGLALASLALALLRLLVGEFLCGGSDGEGRRGSTVS